MSVIPYSNLDLRFHSHNDRRMPLSYYMHVIAVDQLVYVHLKCMFPTFRVHNG